MSKVIIPSNNFISLLEDMTQNVMIDANIIVPPDRSSLRPTKSPQLCMSFEMYQKVLLDPLFRIIPNIIIHDSVYQEIIHTKQIKDYIDKKIDRQQLIFQDDRNLNALEESVRQTVQTQISQYTNYDPGLDNAPDRGEVKSLAYAVAKGFVYFSTNDSNALMLFKQPQLHPFLNDLKTIRLYELIYGIRAFTGCSSKGLKGLYKLMYHLTKPEKDENPEWGKFYSDCDYHYGEYLKK